jgi:hypothetical protein
MNHRMTSLESAVSALMSIKRRDPIYDQMRAAEAVPLAHETRWGVRTMPAGLDHQGRFQDYKDTEIIVHDAEARMTASDVYLREDVQRARRLNEMIDRACWICAVLLSIGSFAFIVWPK